MNPGDPLPPDVVDAWRHGNKIEAIRRLRIATGLGLAEAKAAVDALERGPVGMSRTAAARPRLDPSHTMLSPGEVPRGPPQGAVWMVTVVALVLALAAWLYSALG